MLEVIVVEVAKLVLVLLPLDRAIIPSHHPPPCTSIGPSVGVWYAPESAAEPDNEAAPSCSEMMDCSSAGIIVSVASVVLGRTRVTATVVAADPGLMLPCTSPVETVITSSVLNPCKALMAMLLSIFLVSWAKGSLVVFVVGMGRCSSNIAVGISAWISVDTLLKEMRACACLVDCVVVAGVVLWVAAPTAVLKTTAEAAM